jgi:hypothetical protein
MAIVELREEPKSGGHRITRLEGRVGKTMRNEWGAVRVSYLPLTDNRPLPHVRVVGRIGAERVRTDILFYGTAEDVTKGLPQIEGCQIKRSIRVAGVRHPQRDNVKICEYV